MLNRISQKLWPVEYWQNKKRIMAGALGGRRIWTAAGCIGLAILFVVTATAGILTALPKESARHIPLRPLPEERLQSLQSLPAEIAAPANKNVEQHKAAPVGQMPAAPSNWPVEGAIIHEFGWQQHPAFKDWRYHAGVDVSAASGQPVVAAMNGTVKELRQDSRIGLTVIIANGFWVVHHGALASTTVKIGDQVTAGQTIGTAGESFQEPYPHVHLAVEKAGKFINPVEVLPR